jgi:hypothetical protein
MFEHELSSEDVAKLLHCSVHTVYGWKQLKYQNDIPPAKLELLEYKIRDLE